MIPAECVPGTIVRHKNWDPSILGTITEPGYFCRGGEVGDQVHRVSIYLSVPEGIYVKDWGLEYLAVVVEPPEGKS